MKYTFEAYKEDGSPRKWVGTFRPPFEEVWNTLKENNRLIHYYAGYTINILPSYNAGNFDLPLYEDE